MQIEPNPARSWITVALLLATTLVLATIGQSVPAAQFANSTARIVFPQH